MKEEIDFTYHTDIEGNLIKTLCHYANNFINFNEISKFLEKYVAKTDTINIENLNNTIFIFKN